MRTPPRTRGRRQAGRPLVLVERDADILALVGRFRYVSTEQIARELFPSVDRCRRRVRALLDAGYIRVSLRGSTKSNLIALTRSGLGALLAQRPQGEALWALAGTIALSAVEHHLLTVDAQLYVAAATRSRAVVVEAGSGTGALARELGCGACGLQPDGVVLLRLRGGEELAIALEADIGTETLGVIETKLARYETLESIDELWFVVAGGERRQRAIAELARSYEVGGITRVMGAESIRLRPAVEPSPVVAAG